MRVPTQAAKSQRGSGSHAGSGFGWTCGRHPASPLTRCATVCKLPSSCELLQLSSENSDSTYFMGLLQELEGIIHAKLLVTALHITNTG